MKQKQNNQTNTATDSVVQQVQHVGMLLSNKQKQTNKQQTNKKKKQKKANSEHKKSRLTLIKNETEKQIKAVEV